MTYLYSCPSSTRTDHGILLEKVAGSSMCSKTLFFGVLLVSFVKYAEMMYPNTNTGLPSAAIEIKSVDVTTSLPVCTNVTVTFVAMKNVQVIWTLREGFLPKDLNGQATMNDYQTHGGKSSSVCLPKDLNIDSLKLHLICENHSFELHLGFKVSHNMTNTYEDVKQYVLLVPKSSEIGISSHGEARFHVMVNTSGTQFLFGLLQTDATVLYGSTAQHDSAFSFLPDDKKKMIRLHKNVQTETEYHTDVILRSRKLQESKTMISVSSACTQPSSVIHRLDMKHVSYLQREADTLLTRNNHPVAITGHQKEEFINVDEQGNALLRCSSFGLPRPNITLYRKEGNRINPYTLPSYTTSLQFEQTKVFQIQNATVSDAGLYICKASNTVSSAEKTYTINVQKV